MDKAKTWCPELLRRFCRQTKWLARPRSLAGVFRTIYRENYWRGSQSVSGQGSDLEQTRAIRAALPGLIAEFGARSMLDLPCGDFHWMRLLALPLAHYIGGDIVPELIARNAAAHGDGRHEFCVLDLTRDPLPRVDVIFCRDCLVHLPLRRVGAAVRNIKASGSRYLIATTFPAVSENVDIPAGLWRPLNLRLAPFHFPEPLRLISEEFPGDEAGRYRDKSLGVWEIARLP